MRPSSSDHLRIQVAVYFEEVFFSEGMVNFTSPIRPLVQFCATLAPSVNRKRIFVLFFKFHFSIKLVSDRDGWAKGRLKLPSRRREWDRRSVGLLDSKRGYFPNYPTGHMLQRTVPIGGCGRPITVTHGWGDSNIRRKTHPTTEPYIVQNFIYIKGVP